MYAFAALFGVATAQAAGPISIHSADYLSSLTGAIGSFGELILTILFTIAGVAAILYLAYYGLQYVQAGGSADKVKAARAGIINAMVGIIVIIASYSIIRLALAGSTLFNNSLVSSGGIGTGPATSSSEPLDPAEAARQHAQDILGHYRPVETEQTSNLIPGLPVTYKVTKECYDGNLNRCLSLPTYNHFSTCMGQASSETAIEACKNAARAEDLERGLNPFLP